MPCPLLTCSRGPHLPSADPASDSWLVLPPPSGSSCSYGRPADLPASPWLPSGYRVSTNAEIRCWCPFMGCHCCLGTCSHPCSFAPAFPLSNLLACPRASVLSPVSAPSRVLFLPPGWHILLGRGLDRLLAAGKAFSASCSWPLPSTHRSGPCDGTKMETGPWLLPASHTSTLPVTLKEKPPPASLPLPPPRYPHPRLCSWKGLFSPHLRAFAHCLDLSSHPLPGQPPPLLGPA